MYRRIFRGVCGVVPPAQSRSTRAVVCAVPRWTNSDADRDLARVAASGSHARVKRRMKVLILLCLVFLFAGCKQPAGETPANTNAPEQAAVPSPSPSPTPPRPTGEIEFTDVTAQAGIRFKHN